MTAEARPWIVNSARGGTRTRLVRDLWQSRDIVGVFVRRDLQLRYRQAALGVAWVLLQPVVTVGLLTIVLSRVQVTSGAVPYPVFALVGMVLWLYFTNAVGRGSEVLVENPSLITKVWFPRATVPAAALISPLVDLAIGFGLLVVVQAILHVPFRWSVLLLPVIVALLMTIAFGLVLVLAAVNVRYRDVRHAIGPALQVLFFATPVAYSLTLLPSWASEIAAVNPLTGVIESARWAVFGTPAPGVHLLGSVLWAVGLLLVGGLYFRSAERTFADVI